MMQRHHIRPRFPRSSEQHNTIWSEVYMEFTDIDEATDELVRQISASGQSDPAASDGNSVITNAILKLRAIREVDLSTRKGNV